MTNDNDNTRALMATIDRLVGERDHLLDEVERVGKIADAVVASVVASERMERDELREIVAMLTSRCDAAERRESELGLQVVAQAARLRLATETIEALRLFDHRRTDVALAAWDAVPGDVVKIEVLPNGDGTASPYVINDNTLRTATPRQDGEVES